METCVFRFQVNSYVFFFQAEDGIRDLIVTGVQTCALPISLIDENLPVVMLATRDENDPESMTRYEKSVSNIKEVKARDGIVISVVTGDDQLARDRKSVV